MNLVSFVNRALKIGGPRIDLVTRDSTYYPSEWISGELFITAADYRQNVQSITINLKEFWFEYLMGGRCRASRYHQHDSIALVHNFAFLPRMKYQFPFEIQLPANCRISSEESGWRMGVVISTFGSSISRADFGINVQLSKALQQILEAIEKDTQFIEIPRGRQYISGTSATRFVFRPPEHLQSELQHFLLDVSWTDEGGIKGKMLFSKSESDSSDQFTLDTGDNYLQEFQIKPAQLFDSESQVDGRTITNLISEKLMGALGSKNH